MSGPARRTRASPLRIFVLVLLGIGAVGSVELVALWRAHHDAVPAAIAAAPPAAPAALPPAPAAARDVAQDIQGELDRPLAEAIVGPKLALSGWALARPGLRAVEVRIDGQRFAAATGIARPDVAAVKRDFTDAAHAGFEFAGDLTPHPAPSGEDRRELEVVAIATDGRERVIARRSVIEPSALTRWSFVQASGPPFYLLPALSGIGLGAASELDTAYQPYLSRTTSTGMRVPILYLRTTRGPAADYAFDPAWDIERRCGSRRIAEDRLSGTLSYAAAHRLPVLVTLNGGVWADAACDVPAWDINDRLEQDPVNCQWNEHDQVMPDDELKHLPGSQEAPELGRTLTFNVYARAVRHYKRRNLQQAARPIVAFMRAHPGLFVGVNLDPDTYLNPFYSEQQWYDYNPGTVRQFREWLSGTGPYAGKPADGAPDLRSYRRARPLTLAQASRLAGRAFATWRDVDPPRSFSRDAAHPFWKDPWVREWELFRRHLVKLHYDDLSRWLVEAGVPRDRIWTSQGLMAPLPNGMPFALRLDSPVKDADSGGMSVEGSVPQDGHLGVILYGASAVNDVPMENGRPLFPTLAQFDPGFGVVEYNTADLRNPQSQPSYAAAYRGLRDLWNAGARFVSPMAWNGSNGVNAGQPGYVTYTAWRNTPLEQAAKDFLLARAGLPLGARLWTFGTPRHADGDGWVAERGAASLGKGHLTLAADAGEIVLVSPGDLAVDPRRVRELVVDVPDGARLRSVDVQVERGGRPEWRTVARAEGAALKRAAAGRVVRLALAGVAPVDRVKLVLRVDSAQPFDLARIALLP
ncbi:MAG TPA: hypothetical protein VLR71_12865 [Casimicrobiaceae bacterium]|nr:hypothetical protein [Casimicrobiaceae bacterium]